MSTIIGLVGAKQSGKDTFAGYLIEDHDYVRVAFADVMKDALLQLNPYIDDGNPVRLRKLIFGMGWDRAKEAYPEVRRLLQVFGTEVGRDLFGENVWIDLALRKIELLIKEGFDVVITDVRFPNEIATVHTLGGKIVRIERDLPGAPRDLHASENAWRDVKPDFTIQNGSLAGLRAAASTLTQIIKTERSAA